MSRRPARPAPAPRSRPCSPPGSSPCPPAAAATAPVTPTRRPPSPRTPRRARPRRTPRRPHRRAGRAQRPLRRAGEVPTAARGGDAYDDRHAGRLHAVRALRHRHRRLPVLPARPRARRGHLAHRHAGAARQPRRRAPRDPVPGPAAAGRRRRGQGRRRGGRGLDLLRRHRARSLPERRPVLVDRRVGPGRQGVGHQARLRRTPARGQPDRDAGPLQPARRAAARHLRRPAAPRARQARLRGAQHHAAARARGAAVPAEALRRRAVRPRRGARRRQGALRRGGQHRRPPPPPVRWRAARRRGAVVRAHPRRARSPSTAWPGTCTCWAAP